MEASSNSGRQRPLNIAIVGATGAVGREMMSILEEREIPVNELRVFASPSSLGADLPFGTRSVVVRTVEPGCFDGIDVVLGATSASIARKYVPEAVKAGAIVIDNSSAFRMDPEVPLVVPEVNAEDIAKVANRGVIANPNCSTIQMVVALRPLQLAAGLKRLVISTYQSTSGTGQKGMEALSREVLKLYRQSHLSQPGDEGEEGEEGAEQADLENGHAHSESIEDDASPYPHQIAFNGLPHIGDFTSDGYTSEELKMVHETRKIMGVPNLGVTATCVRVPWFACHAVSVNVELERNLTLAEARKHLAEFPGIIVQDRPEDNEYPMPFPLAGSDDVYVGRIRQDFSQPNTFNLWVVADNLRKGAALNAVQILERWRAQQPA